MYIYIYIGLHIYDIGRINDHRGSVDLPRMFLFNISIYSTVVVAYSTIVYPVFWSLIRVLVLSPYKKSMLHGALTSTISPQRSIVGHCESSADPASGHSIPQSHRRSAPPGESLRPGDRRYHPSFGQMYQSSCRSCQRFHRHPRRRLGSHRLGRLRRLADP